MTSCSPGPSDLNIACSAVDYAPLVTTDDGDTYEEQTPADEPDGTTEGEIPVDEHEDTKEEHIPADEAAGDDSGGEKIRGKLIVAFMCLLCMI